MSPPPKPGRHARAIAATGGRLRARWPSLATAPGAPGVPGRGVAARDDRVILMMVLAIAALVRIPTVFFELYHHPDEVWQYLEPAYRLVVGPGVIPWEYRAGIRSWLIPMLLAPPMALGKLIWPDSILYLVPVRLMLVAWSLAIVGCGTMLGLRISRLHGLVVGLALATWFELAYFSARALSDMIAASAIFAAAWALLPDPDRTPRRLLLGGVLLGFAFSARFQLAPCLAVLVIGCCRRDMRAWRMVIAGGLLGLAAGALADGVAGAVPFRWMWENVRLNLVESRSRRYGVASPALVPDQPASAVGVGRRADACAGDPRRAGPADPAAGRDHQHRRAQPDRAQGISLHLRVGGAAAAAAAGRARAGGPAHHGAGPLAAEQGRVRAARGPGVERMRGRRRALAGRPGAMAIGHAHDRTYARRP